MICIGPTVRIPGLFVSCRINRPVNLSSLPKSIGPAQLALSPVSAVLGEIKSQHDGHGFVVGGDCFPGDGDFAAPIGPVDRGGIAHAAAFNRLPRIGELSRIHLSLDPDAVGFANDVKHGPERAVGIDRLHEQLAKSSPQARKNSYLTKFLTVLIGDCDRPVT